MVTPLDGSPDAGGPSAGAVGCVHASACPGCPLIDVPYPAQLVAKRARVAQAAARYAALAGAPIEPTLAASPVTGYRTRAKLIVAPGARIGLYTRGSAHEVVDIPSCVVLAPAIARVVAVLRERVAADEATGGPLAPQGRVAGRAAGRAGALRAVDLREARDGAAVTVLLTLVVDGRHASDLGPLRAAARELLRAAPEIAGVAASLHGGEGPQVLGRETVPLAGSTSAPDRLGASRHIATFGSFVQVHREQAERVHDALARAVLAGAPAGRAPRVLDLYGGSGSLALALAAAGAQVRLVESFGPAVAQARAAAAAEGVAIEAIHGDVDDALRALAEAREPVDAVVVNPPRRGTGPLVRERIARLAPPRVAYLSCDPETLARDLDHLERLGYRAASLRPIDLIPLTDQVEALAVLERGPVPPPRVVYEDATLLVVDKGPHEPTTPQGEYAGSLLARARQLPGAGRATPVHRLDVGTSGLVFLAKGPEHVEAWARALGAGGAVKSYIAGVRGITPLKGSIARALRDEGKLREARTRYRRTAVVGGHSVLRVLPDQGRTHQIRRHLASIGHAVLGDDRYGHAPTNRHFEEKHALDRTFLHCARIEVAHPEAGAPLVVESELPGDLRTVLDRAGA